MKETEKGRIRDALILFKDGRMNLDEVITLIGDMNEGARNNQTDVKLKQNTTIPFCESYGAKPYKKGNTDEDAETSSKEERMNLSEPFLEED